MIIRRLNRIVGHLSCERRRQITNQNQNHNRILSNLRTMATRGDKIVKSDQEWKKELSAQEFQVIRNKGTERAFTGEYDKFYPTEGYFACKACGNPLYSAQAKFNSGCGWPAFDKCYKDSVNTHTDTSLGMRRVEITCARCDGHLGHVFHGENLTETNERHCVNSVSVKYVKAQQQDQEEETVKEKI